MRGSVSVAGAVLTLVLVTTGCTQKVAPEPSAVPNGSSSSVQSGPPMVTPPPQELPACPVLAGGACLGRLRPLVTYRTSTFSPSISYSVPDESWFNYADQPGRFLLVPPGPQNTLPGVDRGTSDSVSAYVAVEAAQFVGATCTVVAVPGVPQSPDGLADWLRQRPELETSPHLRVTIGGLSGVVVQVALPVGGGRACPDDADRPIQPLFLAPDGQRKVVAGVVVRLYLLSYGGGVLAVEVDDVAAAIGGLGDYSVVVEGLTFAV